MTKKNRRTAVELLEYELSNKLRLVQQLEKENMMLQLKQFLLAAFCDSLGQLRQQTALSEEVASANELLLLEQLAQQSSNDQFAAYICPIPPPVVRGVHSIGGTSPALDLQAQSIHSTSSGHSSICDSGNGPDAVCRTLRSDDGVTMMVPGDNGGFVCAAPADDPLYLFRLCLALAEDSRKESPSLQDLLAAAAQMARDMSYHLHQYELGAYEAAFAPDDPARPQPIQRIRAAFLQYYSLWCRALLTMRGDLATDVTLTSYDGSGLITQEHNRALYRSFIRQLGLKPDQLQYLAQGIVVFRDLRSPVLEATGLLQQEIAAQEASCVNTSPTINTSTADSSDSSSAGVSCQPSSATGLASMHQSLFQHLGRNNQQEARLTRMQALLGKDLILRAALGGFVFGALTWPQIAKAVVGASPFTLGAMPLSVAILELNDEVQGQQPMPLLGSR